MQGVHERINPWPSNADKRQATATARGDNAKIAALAAQVSRFHRDFPHGAWPNIPPIVPPLDVNGAIVMLDVDVIVNRFRQMTRTMPDHWTRAKVVGIGDPGLPGREVLRIRLHGGTYTTVAGPKDVEVHVFDEYRWVQAEEAAAKELSRPTWKHPCGVSLETCLFGGFNYEEFQRQAGSHYVRRIT